MPQTPDLDQLAINTIRMLAADAVQKAHSGHPGTPMGAAPTAYALWQRYLRYDPTAPEWMNRDRFVLSVGHASMLLYALLHLTGVKGSPEVYGGADRPAVTLDDIKQFRQEGSRCPGHPEYRHTSGVEATTGPLGQGAGDSVGMAIAGKWLAATYNRPDFTLFDYNVYALCGDGDMMEGIASEAASLAGHLELSNLCWIYDSNRVTIEGHTDIAYSEDVAARFLAYGWNVTTVADANDLTLLDRAYRNFLKTTDKPTLILVHSQIGYGAPNLQGSPKAHGEPLGEAELRGAKEFFGFAPDESFVVPPEVPAHFAAGLGARGATARDAWDQLLARYHEDYPDLAGQVDAIQAGALPENWEDGLPSFPPDAKGMATRDASGKVLNALAQRIPWLLGGAADLSPSTKTNLTFEGAGSFEAPGLAGNYLGRNFHFGIREHAMVAAVNGMALSGLRAYAAGFLIFTDYARGAIRLSALMELPVVHVWTHDSIGVGEDGPTHQPIEQLLSLRAIPGMVVLRPADANEVSEAWRVVMNLKNRPAAIVCSRQPLPTIDRDQFAAASLLARGAYVLADPADGKPSVILIGTGSEVHLCMAARERLMGEGIAVRVVSMPSWELFEAQDQAYQDSVLPPEITARVAVEAASPLGWDRYAGRRGIVLGMHSFGLSAPIAVTAAHFGFTAGRVAEAAKQAMAAV
ncbi:MAG: transketolase [Rhodospirillales bacterium]|nr:transketolase [Rhodospirillales bacterium]